MEPNMPLAAAPRSSLIVKLRHQPLCAQCADMLPRWCDPPTRHKVSKEPHRSSSDCWMWSIETLKQSASTCNCCRFLVQVLEASPWIQLEGEERVGVQICNMGSQHKAQSSDRWAFKTYYRPLLFGGEMIWGTRYSFILPVPQVHDATSDEDEPQIFCGRPVDATVDLSLIASWHKICMSRHEGLAVGHGCRPNTHEPVRDFRVIDVEQRCVVRTSGKIDYAALSYVWGNAKRLVLSKDNEAWLTTPGALSQAEDNVPKTFRDALEVATALGIANLWVDALCIDQTDPEQVEHHMDAMDKIYESAVLTIVATTENADSGLPGISLPRGPPQAVFQYNGVRYLSSRPTFGAAMHTSPWEKRAWCLQEKLFSTRLLVFTDAQVFYHCRAATWFEDTIMEFTNSNHAIVRMRENTVAMRKPRKVDPLRRGLVDFLKYTAYDTQHTALKDESFWSLVQSYSKRELSYEDDVIRAFGGILRSVEAQHGRAVWGIPQYHFLRGLSWFHSGPQMGLRRKGFPSWSWVGWHTGRSHLCFANCKRKDNDIGVMDGRYRVARNKYNGRSVWDLTWYNYTEDEHSHQMRLKPVQLERLSSNGKPHVSPPAITAVSRTDPELSKRAKRKHKRLHEWGLPSHPGSTKPIHELMPPLPSGPDMPGLSHILRFYTSVAILLVDSEGVTYGSDISRYRLLVPGTDIMIATVELDPHWSGIGKTHSLVYISRYCSDYSIYVERNDHLPERLHLLLVESVPGWGEVKRRVQMVRKVSILDWRKANPRWELVNLA